MKIIFDLQSKAFSLKEVKGRVCCYVSYSEMLNIYCVTKKYNMINTIKNQTVFHQNKVCTIGRLSFREAFHLKSESCYGRYSRYSV